MIKSFDENQKNVLLSSISRTCDLISLFWWWAYSSSELEKKNVLSKCARCSHEKKTLRYFIFVTSLKSRKWNSAHKNSSCWPELLWWHARDKISLITKVFPHHIIKFTTEFQEKHNHYSIIMTSEDQSDYKHHDTFIKAKIQKAIEFCERINILYYKNDVFRTFEVSKNQEYQMLQSEISASRRSHDSEQDETRGRKSLITSKDIREMKRVLKSEEFEVRALTWKQLNYEVDLKISDKTIKRHMRTMNYHKCIACRKDWVSSRTATRRVEYALDIWEHESR